MIRIVAAAALAAFLLYDATTAPGFTGGLTREQPTRELKGDRLPVHSLESFCSESTWPYDRSGCLAGQAQPGGPALTVRLVRVVTTDRMPDGSFRRSLTN